MKEKTMGFEVAGFLESLFGGGPAPAAVLAREVAPAPSGKPEPDLGADPFAAWVQRPDCRGRMGWEAPDLPEWQRWWARCDFDELPEPNTAHTTRQADTRQRGDTPRG